MDSQVVETVLAECGQDIDAAIRRLNQLKLTTEQSSSTQQAAAQPDTAAAQDNPQQQEHAQQAAAVAAAAAAAVASGPQTADQWVDALVQEMATAKDIPDARSRAGKLLHAFEQFMTSRSKAEARLEEVSRENAILKRAVQIQNAKLQEASAKDEEITGLKQMLGQYQERLRQMELNNYSLALHLQKATNDSFQTPNRPPDVF
jgi:chromosome segregation ATPase